jgi:hypothetical protein
MDIAQILDRKYKDQPAVLNGWEYSGLVWLADTPKPTKAALEKLWPTVQAEIEAEAQAKEDAKSSAIAKLEALGLTLDEVQAAFGIGAS